MGAGSAGPPPVETPLLRRSRESVLGDDQVMVGPFGPRIWPESAPGALLEWGMAAAARPVRVELVDRMPLLASGKPDRRALEQLVRGGRTT